MAKYVWKRTTECTLDDGSNWDLESFYTSRQKAERMIEADTVFYKSECSTVGRDYQDRYVTVSRELLL